MLDFSPISFTILLLFHLLAFWPGGIWDLSSPIRVSNRHTLHHQRSPSHFFLSKKCEMRKKKKRMYVHIYICNGEGDGNPLQYSCLENPMERGAWQATVHGVAKSRTRLSNFTSLQQCLNLFACWPASNTPYNPHLEFASLDHAWYKLLQIILRKQTMVIMIMGRRLLEHASGR